LVECAARWAWIAAAFVSLALGFENGAGASQLSRTSVKIIVPIGPGGSYDLVGRLLAEVLSKRTGQTSS